MTILFFVLYWWQIILLEILKYYLRPLKKGTG